MIGQFDMEGIKPQNSMQRARGQIDFRINGPHVTHLYQSGCSKLMLPKTYGIMREAVLLNTAGGITGGDALNTNITASDCNLVVTSQTAERFYRSNMQPASISIVLKANNGAKLHWIPQETILFEGAAVDRTIRLDMAHDCNCLLAETLVFGRGAMGEKIRTCHFTDQWRLYEEGKLFHSEAIRMTGDIEKLLDSKAGAYGARIISTIICARKNLELLRPIVEKKLASMRSVSAASFFNGKMIIRLLNSHCLHGRTDFNQILMELRRQPMPRVWQL